MSRAATPSLIDKANECLWPSGKLTSKSGMTRTELRVLERAGVVKKSYAKPKGGAIECFWELA